MMTEAQNTGQTTENTPTGAPEEASQPQVPEGYLHQKDVNKIAGSRAKEARQAAINDLLEKSGAESIDDVISVYEAHKLTQAEMETAADKAEKARQKAEEKASAAEQRYTTTLREYALRDALRDSGINPERIRGALRLADTSALEVDSEGNVSGLEEVVEAVRNDSPEWFGEQRARVNAPQANGAVQASSQGDTPDEKWANQLLNILGTR